MADEAVLPTWKYSVTGESRIIHTAEELAALEAGQWFESPQAAADAAARASTTETETTRRPTTRRDA